MATQEERRLAGQIAAFSKWSRVADRTAATAPARAGLDAKFERQVDPDGLMTPTQRRQAAEAARKAFFLKLALKSAQARRLRATADRLEGEAAAGMGAA